jgi:predicted flap endonuclease-1-like 5' DNA nuclease
METTAPLILIALLAVVVIAGILWGIKLRRQRSESDRIVSSNRIAAEQGTPGSTITPPVAPSPPPLADEPIVAAAAFDATPSSIAAEMAEAEPAPETVAEPAPVAAPAPAPAPAPVPAPITEPAAPELTQLKGLGPKLVAALAELGITSVDQIAALTPDQAQDLDARLGNFRGRLARDRWIEQARLLAAGDRAAYEAEFGKLG